MQKLFVSLLNKIKANMRRSAAIAVVIVMTIFVVRSTLWYEAAWVRITDTDPDRGATTVTADPLGDKFTKVVYLEQGWAPADSLWFYNTTQGSDLLPYDFFLTLEQANSEKLFRDPENINAYRYLPQKATASNPDGLPLGMVQDTYRGKKYMGFTCAACHSSQVNFQGVGIRIDGGPGAADMTAFMEGLEASLRATANDAGKKKRFMAAVLAKGNYSDEPAIQADLDKYFRSIESYNFFNYSKLPGQHDAAGKEIPLDYGFARLDAFGRIYNRTLEHIINPEVLRTVLTDVLPPNESAALLQAMKPVLDSDNRDHLIAALTSKLSLDQRRQLRDKIFNSPNAPVSYPFIWDIPQHDYVQWNGIGANAGVGPIGRNTGEVIGVFGTLDWAEKKGWTISSVLGGQGFGDKHISFQSSVNVHNLRKIEDRLGSLQSPLWADAVAKAGLPGLNDTTVARGKKLFDTHCADCHAQIDRTSDQRRIVAEMDDLSETKTDPTMANNGVDYEGYSGILRNKYMDTEVGGVLLNTRAPIAAMLTVATENVVATPDPDKSYFTRGADWLVDLAKAFFSNKIKPSVRQGRYTPATTAKPFESLRAYKGRSLNGIWATAPYLHNGSVPTLYDLLLPAEKQANDPPDTKYRPATFFVGSRELDPKDVGFVQNDKGFLFDTSKPGNRNTGHEYGTRALSEPERRDLLEYLKSL